MIKPSFIILMVIFFVCVPWIIGCQGEEMTYTTYTDTDHGVSFDYPANWQKGELDKLASDFYRDGVEITFKGPPESVAGIGYTALTLTVTPSSKNGGELSDLKDYFEKTILARGYGDYKVESKEEITLSSGDKGYEATVSYDTFRPMRSIERQKIPTKDTWLVIEKNGYFYDLEFTASAKDYGTYLEAYRKAKDTLIIKNL